jgi:CubicO group peptidase (beta-lactamase class C family)
VDAGVRRVRRKVEDGLWPLLEGFVSSHDVAGLAVAVLSEGEVVARGFGVRDVGTGMPVTAETMFHLASVSKPVVTTALVSLASAAGGRTAVLDLDEPIGRWVPEFTLADGREAEVTARRLLSHTSGLPDVREYRWHDPDLGDEALSEFARSLSGWRLESEPGTEFSYCNAGFELLGLVLARVVGTTFEEAVRRLVLAPLGMRRSTFLRAEVPEDLEASPHVGMPLIVPGDAYPYTRRHAPSSSLHSNLVEMCRFLTAHLDPVADRERTGGQWARLDPSLVDLLWRPVVPVGRPPWEESAALGWAVGSYRGHRTVGHSGLDPGFGSRIVLVPERGTGVVVLANSNTVPASAIAKAALDVVLSDSSPEAITRRAPAGIGEGVTALGASLRPVVGPIAETLATSGPDLAAEAFRTLAALEPAEYDLDDEGFVDAVWGAIELHRTWLVQPLLNLWTQIRPDSSSAWTMTGWAHQVDGELDLARDNLRRALDLDPDNQEAAEILDSCR